MQCYAKKQALGEVSQELLDTQVNPAVWEISGHMVLKRKKDFEEASEAYAWRLLSEVSLSEERFQEVKAYISDATCLEESWGRDRCKREQGSPSGFHIGYSLSEGVSGSSLNDRWVISSKHGYIVSFCCWFSSFWRDKGVAVSWLCQGLNVFW